MRVLDINFIYRTIIENGHCTEKRERMYREKGTVVPRKGNAKHPQKCRFSPSRRGKSHFNKSAVRFYKNL